MEPLLSSEIWFFLTSSGLRKNVSAQKSAWECWSVCITETIKLRYVWSFFLFFLFRRTADFSFNQRQTRARACTGHAHWRLPGLSKQSLPQRCLLRPRGLIKAMPRKQSHRQQFTTMRLVRSGRGGVEWLQNKSHNLECQRRNDYFVNNVDTDNIVTSYSNPTAEMFFRFGRSGALSP